MKKRTVPKIVTRVRIPLEVHTALWRFVHARSRTTEKRVSWNEIVTHALRFYLENMIHLVGSASYENIERRSLGAR